VNRPAEIGLLAKLSQGRTQRGAGDLKEAFERAVELEDQKDRTGNRQRADEENSDHGGVSRSEEPEAGKDNAQPEHQHDEEWNRIELPSCSNNNIRMRPKSRAVVKAWLRSER